MNISIDAIIFILIVFQMSGHFTEYIVIALYLFFMLITGVAFRRFIKNFADYFRSGCRGTWWLVGASIFMYSFSAWTFTGAAGVAYTSGLSVAVIFIANATGYFINYLVTARRFRQLRATTFPEVIQQRFDTTTQQFYVWMGIIPGILMAGLTLWGVAVFTSAVFGFNIKAVIVVLGIVVLVYSTIGGLWSVMATDFLQALILMPLTILIAFLSLQYIGGIGALFTEIKQQNLPDMLSLVDSTPGTMFTPGWAVAMFVFVLLSYNSMGSAVKYFACKDENEARKAALLASILMAIGAFLWFIPPIVARLRFSDIIGVQNIAKPAEAAYAVISMKLLPNGLSGLIVVAMFSATMSSIDSQLNQFAAIFTQDVYRPFLRKHASQREIFIVGQVASLLTGILIISAALYLSQKTGKGLFDYMMQFGSLLGTPMIVPMFLALFIRRVPPWSALFSICCGFVFSYQGWKHGWKYEHSVFSIVFATTTAFFITMPYCRIRKADGRLAITSFILFAGYIALVVLTNAATPILVLGILLAILLSTPFWLKTPESYRGKVGSFFTKMTTPVDFEKEVGAANDNSQLRIVGYVSGAIGLFICLLTTLRNTWTGRLQILFVAGCILLFSSLMLIISFKNNKDSRDVDFPATD